MDFLFLFYFHLKQKDAKELFDQEKEIILANLAHELRTPITSMLLELENLQLSSQVQPAYLNNTRKQLDRLSQIAEASHSIIKFSKIQDASQYSTSIMKLNEELVTFGNQFGIKISTLRNFDLLKIRGAPEYIKIAIQNLIQNALKHGKPPVHISASLNEDNSRLIIQIKDEGVLSESLVKNKSMPFFDKKKSNGMGLGLHLVETIMQHFGGSFEVGTNPTRMTLNFEVIS